MSEVDGEWRNIYKMLGAGNRGIDYFSRGIMEIEAEAPRTISAASGRMRGN